MKQISKSNMKKIVQRALKERYGFSPALNDIKLLESFEGADPGHPEEVYVNFKAKHIEYEFDSCRLSDGSVWVDSECIHRIG